MIAQIATPGEPTDSNQPTIRANAQVPDRSACTFLGIIIGPVIWSAQFALAFFLTGVQFDLDSTWLREVL
jgi:hypothetical protein